jgi:hypothetical protein
LSTKAAQFPSAASNFVSNITRHCRQTGFLNVYQTPPFTALVGPQISRFIMGVMLKKPADAPGSATPAIVIGMFVAFGGVLFGYVALLVDLRTFSDRVSAMILAPLVASLPCTSGETNFPPVTSIPKTT